MKTPVIFYLAHAAGTLSLAAETSWPIVSLEKPDVRLQNHVSNIAGALEKSGQPLPNEAKQKLDGALASGHFESIQQVLDPLCLGALRLSKDGAPQFVAAPAPPKALEQGWRPFLLKIANADGRRGTLRIKSPNARPIPNAPKEEVEARWLDLDATPSTPFSPNLSGLPLEYRLITLWARDAGSHPATFEFNLGHVPADSGAASVKRWDFSDDPEGWQTQRDSSIEVGEGALQIANTGGDPQMSAALAMPPGEKLVRFRAKNASTPNWQIFWWTDKHPETDGRRSRSMSVFQDNGDWSEYSLTFRSGEALAGLRIDPGSGPGRCAIDWIEIIGLDEPAPEPVSGQVSFQVEPSHEVKCAVRDEHGKPCTAAFIISDEKGRIYPLMSKRLAPDFFFQRQIYRADGENVRLPAGNYSVTCWRGPESIPEKKKLVITENAGAANDGAHAPVIDYQVKRWTDPAARGWFSGDHHIHAAGCAHYTNPSEGVHASDMQRHIMGEDLKVGCNLTWGPCFDYQKQFFTGRIDKASQYPYLLRYDIEVSGFGSHQSGHLCLLRLKEQIIPGGESKHHWPTLGLNTLKWAKAQGAVCGPAHSGAGLSGDNGRVAGPDGPNGLPNYVIPHLDGIGACEYVVDITHEVPGPDGKPVPAVDFISTMDTDRRSELNMWYHTLNCGFLVRASGETDFPCITGERVGDGRVYVKQDGKLEFDSWCQGIQDGRSYVSDGTAHIIDFVAGGVAVGENGSELKLARGGTVKVAAHVAARRDGGKEVAVELVVNGYPAVKQMVAANGTAQDLSFEIPIERSSWVALRIFPHAHTNPVFVIVDEKPIRASRRSAEWFRRCVDQCWKVKEKTYAEAEKQEAQVAYDYARKVYDRLITESDIP
ncbi:MAG: CehA/McbA family metallohydrolase [Verrucomicrobiales bacterium]